MEKKMYTKPVVEIIQLDNEISLTLDSTPPMGPDETEFMQKNLFNNDDSFV